MELSDERLYYFSNLPNKSFTNVTVTPNIKISLINN